MTLIGAILKKVQSKDSDKNYKSPPPEVDETIFKKKAKKRIDKFGHVKPIVDTSPPCYDARRLLRALPGWSRDLNNLYSENVRTLWAITNAYVRFGHVKPIVDTSPPCYDARRLSRALPGWSRDLNNLYSENVRTLWAITNAYVRGKVDSRWAAMPLKSKQYLDNRRNKCTIINRQNRYMYRRITETGPRVTPTACLEVDWKRNKKDMVQKASKKFVLFPITTPETMEDSAFAASPGVQRPRVYITLGMRNGAQLGTLVAELFTDVCPSTCQLFLELLDGDGLGYSYVGTKFFRKVPHLFWSGGDVIHDNGFGCYAQRGRVRPILAENYHFSHSMPGLLSMRTTKDQELCGSFNITFKALPQFDLKNVVFGRIIRPCPTFDVIRGLGNPLRPRPVVEISGTRRRVDSHWVTGASNAKLRTNSIHVTE